MLDSTCCFIGHRTIRETDALKERLYQIVKELITQHHVDTFLFGSKSRFNDLCYNVVTDIQQTYPHISRIYVRAEFPIIHDDYKSYLLESYENTYYPANIHKAGKAVYIERNYDMIRNSQFCVIYYDETIAPTTRTSGTKIALDYAKKQKKEIFLLV